MLRSDLDSEDETIENDREPVRRRGAPGEQIRSIPVDEQEHRIGPAAAPGVDGPDATGPEERARSGANAALR